MPGLSITKIRLIMVNATPRSTAVLYICILMKRRGLILFFMVLTLSLVTFMQGYWLVHRLQIERSILLRQVNNLLRETGFRLHFKGTGADAPAGWMQEKSLNTVVLTDAPLRTEDKETVSIRMHSRTLQISPSLPPEELSPSSRFVGMIKSDSGGAFIVPKIDTAELRQEFSLALKQENLPITFSFRLSQQPDTLPDLPGKLRTHPVPVDFAEHGLAVADLGGYKGLVFKRTLHQLLISLGVIALCTFTLLLLWRNLRASSRLAQQQAQLISNITHELKTPIATVSVALEAMQQFQQAQNPEKMKEYLAISRQEMDRLTLLTDKVLRLSLLEYGQLALQLEPCDLQQIAASACESMRIQAAQAGGDIQFQAAAGDYHFTGDRLHLLSVVINLLDNAIKYAVGPPRVSLSLQTTAQGIEITVKDEGCGIAPADQKKVFEKFFRVSEGNVHTVKGFGLGLSYVNEMMKRHGGTVQLQSSPGKGSTFTLHFPRHESR